MADKVCALCGKQNLGGFSRIKFGKNQFICHSCMVACIGGQVVSDTTALTAMRAVDKHFGGSKNWTVDGLREMIETSGKVQALEYRKKCNSCGNTFFYTQRDLDKNEDARVNAIMSSLAGAATAFSGHYAASAVSQGNADRNLNQVVDYNKCPKCNSIDTRLLSDEEWEVEKQSLAAPNANAPAVSSADELLKFKSLLDSGVITQEEFDAKKQQLLGL